MIFAIAAALLTAVLLYMWLFKDWDDFLECVKFWLMPDIVSMFRGKYWEDAWAEFKLLLWLGISIGVGALYAPEIFVLSEKRISFLLFYDGYFVPLSGFFPVAAPIRKTLCANCVMFLFGTECGLCVLLRCAGCFFGAFYRIEKQPARLSLLNLRFRRPLVASSDSGIRLAVE